MKRNMQWSKRVVISLYFLWSATSCSAIRRRLGKIVTPNDVDNNYIPEYVPHPIIVPSTETTPPYVPPVSIVTSLPVTTSIYVSTSEMPKIVVPISSVSPTNPTKQFSKAEQKCGEYTHTSKRRQVTPYVIGGEQALIKEFPHMAALGYGPLTNIQWLCGGSLISEEYVLTAAHCLNSQQLGEVKWVRLGDTNLKSSYDDYAIQQLTVIDQKAHPNYKPPSLYNDIALLKLDHPASFTEYVRPICLYTSSEVLSNELVATGWGKTKYGGTVSDVLMKVNLEPFLQAQCYQTYLSADQGQLSFGIDGTTQICAGSSTDSRDTCEGDSGGPLQIKKNGLMYLIGITSFGVACGTPNRPAVYTRISYYLPWIESIVWPY